MIEYYDEIYVAENCTSPESQAQMKEAGYTGPGWYFWDETQSGCYGPYASALKAHQEQARYAREVLGD
jgi:hypothetical protein